MNSHIKRTNRRGSGHPDIRQPRTPRSLVPTVDPASFLGRVRPQLPLERLRAHVLVPGQGQLAASAPSGEIARNEARTLVAAVDDLTRAIADASRADKATLYRELGIELTYHPDGRILVEARPAWANERVGGGT